MPSLVEAAIGLLTRQDDGSNDPSDSSYGYLPTESICIMFLVLFSLSTGMSIHTGQATYYRMWWLFPSVILGGLGEILGWSGRLWSNRNLDLETPFMIEISTTIMSPTFILAANFIIFGRMIDYLGTGYSRLPARLYSRIFISCDVISLVVQGAGGGVASAATTHDGANLGAHIMLGGIVFQFVIISLYAALATEFLIRYTRDNPFTGRTNSSSRTQMTPRTRIMLGALGFNTLCLFIRAIYRIIELSDGWSGRIIRTQIYFNVLDGGMVILAIYTFNFIHPGMFLPQRPSTVDGLEMGRTPLYIENKNKVVRSGYTPVANLTATASNLN
ncbi:RTA1-domain-containing protein [Pluteus cervinus]|uniref:RTA1-domain-containing protein n=1 Tax=Pluteus cervinus TaxID=181527 RepID=A0ACD3AKZ9_9AGAR|nr:RTA1-domain-containing protein [Pluteus cervinus]